MVLTENFRVMARYNQWMNAKMYEVVSDLPAAERTADRGAYFGSIEGTLNHILVGDLVWMKRFADGLPDYSSLDPVRAMTVPDQLDQMLYPTWEGLKIARQAMDDHVLRFCDQLTDSDLEMSLVHANMAGEPQRGKLGLLVHHFFNHQTHHRGQVTTLLSQFGIDVGVTDLAVIVREWEHN